MSKSEADPDLDLESLRSQWSALYRTTLPSLAKSRDPVQPHWPVILDHCFARIILDNTLGKSAGPNGKDVPWDQVISKPAVKTMTESQLKRAIELGGKIARGEVDLVELDEWSLEARGKEKKGGSKRSVADVKGEEGNDKKRRKVDQQEHRVEDTAEEKENVATKSSPHGKSKATAAQKKQKQTQSTLSFNSSSPTSPSTTKNLTKFKPPSITDDTKLTPSTIITTLQKIQTHPNLTPFRKRLYTSLLSVPTGQHTTYAALATHLKSVPRAVGNGMRNNPFAPTVPCHRVLASDGSLGGFFGDWGVEGKYGAEKVELLRGEGVGFDSRGRVKGVVWDGFWDLEGFEKVFGRV